MKSDPSLKQGEGDPLSSFEEKKEVSIRRWLSPEKIFRKKEKNFGRKEEKTNRKKKEKTPGRAVEKRKKKKNGADIFPREGAQAPLLKNERKNRGGLLPKVVHLHRWGEKK